MTATQEMGETLALVKRWHEGRMLALEHESPSPSAEPAQQRYEVPTPEEQAANREAERVRRILVRIHQTTEAGYTAGLNGKDADPPRKEPARQTYLAAHSRGSAARRSLARTENPDKAGHPQVHNTAALIAAISARPYTGGRTPDGEGQRQCQPAGQKGQEAKTPAATPQDNELAGIP